MGLLWRVDTSAVEYVWFHLRWTAHKVNPAVAFVEVLSSVVSISLLQYNMISGYIYKSVQCF